MHAMALARRYRLIDLGSCGGRGQQCCPGSVCGSGDCCRQGRCETATQCVNCGAVSQACCAGRSCTGGTCVGGGGGNPGTCQACGGAGQACCGGGGFVGGGICTVPGTGCTFADGGLSCQVCGGVGQTCCGVGGDRSCTAPGTSCTGGGGGTARTCEACGASGPGLLQQWHLHPGGHRLRVPRRRRRTTMRTMWRQRGTLLPNGRRHPHLRAGTRLPR
jgi:hypothetical protein